MLGTYYACYLPLSLPRHLSVQYSRHYKGQTTFHSHTLRLVCSLTFQSKLYSHFACAIHTSVLAGKWVALRLFSTIVICTSKVRMQGCRENIGGPGNGFHVDKFINDSW